MPERNALDWLHEAHMDAAQAITEWICRYFVIGYDGSKPDPADVHEDVREDLQYHLVDPVVRRLLGA